jgi:sugar lactone lactonase YvrE
VLSVAEGGAVSRMTPGGQLAPLAGDPSDQCNAGLNWKDGTGGDARLGCILGMAVDNSGTLYVAADGHVGSVSPDGTVTSLVADADCRGCWPNAVAVDAGGRLYFTADDYSLRMRTPDGRVTVLAEGPSDERGMGEFGRVNGVAVDPQGSRIFVTDVDGLNRVTPVGAVTLVRDPQLPYKEEYPNRSLGGIAMGANGTIYAIQNGSVLTIRGA